MFKKETLPFQHSGVLNPLVHDYLKKDKKIIPFYSQFPNEEGFRTLLNTKLYANFNRNELVAQLHRQAKLVANTSDSSIEAIQKLNQLNTFTVTTGHQLCLFTGPLYFIYKIISTINLAKQLTQKFPEHNFVPVYWMASEDHDFEEVNHFHSNGKTIQWTGEQKKGAVGEFDTKELKALLIELSETFGISENANYLKHLFESAYLKHSNLSDATRYLVNELFSDKGLVIIDGNDANFKAQFKTHLTDDLFHQIAFEKVNQSINDLQKLEYHTQVNPRPINCFYHDKGIRSRIEKEGEVFKVLDTSLRFTKKELETLIQNHPEKISPNVVLRPLYQQVILPNVAYVGGPGELAYWLEFKSFFESSKVCFPILMPRNFVLFVDKTSANKLKKLKFNKADVFKSEQNLIQLIQEKNKAVFELADEIKSLQDFYKNLNARIKSIDTTLIGSVSAEEKKSLNGLMRVHKKANRALRKGLETERKQIQDLKLRLFPNKVPQERYENFSSLYLTYGKSLFDTLFENLDPFLQEQILFTEE